MSIYKSCRKTCPEFIVNDFVTNTVKTIPVRIGYKNIRVTLKDDKLTEKNLTYCCLTSLSIVCRKGCLVDIVDLVVKSGPKNKKLRQIIPVHELLKRETFFYNTIVMDLMEFHNEVKIEVPTLIAATLNESEEAIILHNAGWSPKYEKWIGELTPTHISTVLKEFSRLHALCFAFEKLQPDRVKIYKKELQGGYFSTFENKQTVKMILSNLNQSLNFFSDEISRKLKKFGDEIEHFLENVINQIPEANVVVHGDPTENFLFSYEKSENNNTPVRAKLIDWQLVKFGSPVLDLSIFLFANCSDDEFPNLQFFLNIYHSNLEAYSRVLNCDIKEFFPTERLEEHWKRYAKYGLAVSFLTLKIMTTNKKPNANNEDLSVEEFQQCFTEAPNEEFSRRIKVIVKYCSDNGLI